MFDGCWLVRAIRCCDQLGAAGRDRNARDRTRRVEAEAPRRIPQGIGITVDLNLILDGKDSGRETSGGGRRGKGAGREGEGVGCACDNGARCGTLGHLKPGPHPAILPDLVSAAFSQTSEVGRPHPSGTFRCSPEFCLARRVRWRVPSPLSWPTNPPIPLALLATSL